MKIFLNKPLKMRRIITKTFVDLLWALMNSKPFVEKRGKMKTTIIFFSERTKRNTEGICGFENYIREGSVNQIEFFPTIKNRYPFALFLKMINRVFCGVKIKKI